MFLHQVNNNLHWWDSPQAEILLTYCVQTSFRIILSVVCMRMKHGPLSQRQEYEKWNIEELYKLAVSSPKYLYDDKNDVLGSQHSRHRE